ncbi:hypothetical protein ABW21_db0200300 [Orbilia brochopaga]|nr:hypothetical protein ABW21_db0200300 [Drechslerella brochopaga]
MEIKISLKLKLRSARKPKEALPPSEETEGATPEVGVGAARKGWRATARKLLGRLKAPRMNPKEVEALTSKITELEQKLEQQGAASRDQFLTLQSHLAAVLTVLMNSQIYSSSSDGENDGSALEEGEDLDAAEIPEPVGDCPSETAVSSVPDEVDGGQSEEGEPALDAARFGGEGDPFDLRRLPARFRCCPPGFRPLGRRIAAAESELRPERSWSSLLTYGTGLFDLSEELDNQTSGSCCPTVEIVSEEEQ